MEQQYKIQEWRVDQSSQGEQQDGTRLLRGKAEL